MGTFEQKVWKCENNGKLTVCIYCETEYVRSNSILSICKLCKPYYENEFEQARKDFLYMKDSNPMLGLYEGFTKIKTIHALRVLEEKRKKKMPETKKTDMTKGKPKPYNKTDKTVVKKISAKNLTKGKPKPYVHVAVGYVLPCFSRMFCATVK